MTLPQPARRGQGKKKKNLRKAWEASGRGTVFSSSTQPIIFSSSPPAHEETAGSALSPTGRCYATYRRAVPAAPASRETSPVIFPQRARRAAPLLVRFLAVIRFARSARFDTGERRRRLEAAGSPYLLAWSGPVPTITHPSVTCESSFLRLHIGAHTPRCSTDQTPQELVGCERGSYVVVIGVAVVGEQQPEYGPRQRWRQQQYGHAEHPTGRIASVPATEPGLRTSATSTTSAAHQAHARAPLVRPVPGLEAQVRPRCPLRPMHQAGSP